MAYQGMYHWAAQASLRENPLKTMRAELDGKRESIITRD